MKSMRLRSVFVASLICMASAVAWAEDSDSEVIIEISSDNMSAEKVEQTITDPIEVLMGNLEDVLLISAKYSDNEAEITVKFDPEKTRQGELVERVRHALDKMTTMPDSVQSLSVSLAEESSAPAQSAPAEPSVTSPAFEPAKKRSFAGDYLGSIQSSNELVPILTRFRKPDDRWGKPSSGEYQMSELKSVVIGQLGACLQKQGYVLDCRWQDKYGQGDVSFQFTDDYERFKARWRIDRYEGEFNWNGAKVKNNED